VCRLGRAPRRRTPATGRPAGGGHDSPPAACAAFIRVPFTGSVRVGAGRSAAAVRSAVAEPLRVRVGEPGRERGVRRARADHDLQPEGPSEDEEPPRRLHPRLRQEVLARARRAAPAVADRANTYGAWERPRNSHTGMQWVRPYPYLVFAPDAGRDGLHSVNETRTPAGDPVRDNNHAIAAGSVQLRCGMYPPRARPPGLPALRRHDRAADPGRRDRRRRDQARQPAAQGEECRRCEAGADDPRRYVTHGRGSRVESAVEAGANRRSRARPGCPTHLGRRRGHVCAPRRGADELPSSHVPRSPGPRGRVDDGPVIRASAVSEARYNHRR
jgi:hypothetical protein